MAKKTNCTINGREYYRITATIDGTRRPFYGDGKIDAERKRDEAIAVAQEAKHKAAQAMKPEAQAEKMVDALMRPWLFDIRRVDPDLDATSFERYEIYYRLHVPQEIKSLKIKDADTLSLQGIFNDLYDSGEKKTSSLKGARKLLVSFFNYCVDQGIIVKNPAVKIVVPGLREARAEKKMSDKDKIEVFSDGELAKIKNASEGNRIRFAVLLALATGMRMGEIMALKATDNLEGKIIDVKRNLVHARIYSRDGTFERKTFEKDPKTESGERTIPFSAPLVAEYKKHLAMLKADKLRAGSAWNPGWQDDPYIFVTASGNTYDKSNFRRAWERLLQDAGVGYKRFHCLRHTYITKLIQAGVDLATVKELAGHSSIQQTLEYTHPELQNKIDAARTLDHFFT